MNKMIVGFLCALVTFYCTACEKDIVEYNSGDIRISVEKGSAYLHDFPLFLGLKIQNPPQMAIWAEDMDGHYLTTVYVTHKIAAQGWTSSGGNRRKEALPYWCYSRGVQYSDGLYLPTKKQPLTDGLTGATPKVDFDVRLKLVSELEKFVVKIEVNHSTDFNENYPESAVAGDKGYSGGKMGSGQPALVYAALVDLSSGQKSFEARLIGHSSPDGSNGVLYPDISTLTTALGIIERIVITIEP